MVKKHDRQFIQTYSYSTSSQHNLYNEICHLYLHINFCEIKNEQTTVSLTVTIEMAVTVCAIYSRHL